MKMIITVDVETREDGTCDAWIASEGSSGSHYPIIGTDEIGENVSDLIECIAESCSEYLKQKIEASK